MGEYKYPWLDPNAPEHVRNRQRVWKDMKGEMMRLDIPTRRPAYELPRALQGVSYGAVVMTHKGYDNGRLSILLGTLPSNLPVVVSSDAITADEASLDRTVADFHGAQFVWHTPWDGRAGHAVQCMQVAPWDYVLFLMDDVWLAPGVTIEALRWTRILENVGVPLASLAIPGWELYHHYMDFGFKSWAETLAQPQKLESVPPNPAFYRAPCLYKNPFGACLVVVKRAYEDLGGWYGGREPKYWANDDTFHHFVWTSGRWVNGAMPGRGYCHYGAQSNHFGETEEWIGKFFDVTGFTADESGAKQYEWMKSWGERLGNVFLKLGGTVSV